MAKGEGIMDIGLEGAGGFSEELKVIRQTEKAYLIETEAGEQVWLPQSVFEDDGELTERGERMLLDKIERGKI